ncbi:MAG: 16S rRNA (adenine(1518)-N(6)/adenine(1519)-N(6))-dimethyltransferase RsmA [Acidobacteriota bacterium]|nr:16S rRNA (adenine(1518)-N(6)/adenine(1519)-N(6))-dimethyltransferase RsmA [Acidobacteriota bacterium]
MSRRLGQHFLTSPALLENIATAVCPDECDTVLEIGPGKGALTTYLLQRAGRVIAIEIDPVLAQYLRSKFRDERRLQIVEGDVLKTDLRQWGPVRVAGNLPYYITSAIIERVLALRPLLVAAVFLVQKEVGQRLTASPGTRDYGYLSIQTQLLSMPEMLFAVPAAAFHPPPKVESAVVRLLPRAELSVPDVGGFLRFAGMCFRQKRKTLRNNLLAAYGSELVDQLPEGRKRAEQLTLENLIELHARLPRVRPL